MRASVVGALVLGTLALLGLLAPAACSSTSDTDDSSDEPEGPGESVDPAYCDKYCRAQVNAGTLQGTVDECLRACCINVPEGCSKGGNDDPDDGGGTDRSDAARDDGSTCARPCGQKCCSAKEGCSVDGAGNSACIPTCTTGADCPTGCCAPMTNASGDPIGPYVCKPNDGKAYNCCVGLTVTCSADNTCCVVDGNDNQFCALKCTSNSQCGAAHCVGYTFGTFTTSCKGPTACGP